MSTLTAAPFNLQFGDLVQVIVSAHNINGYSVASVVNTAGATIRRKPSAMIIPTSGTSTNAA
jgi:hypothetical protein